MKRLIPLLLLLLSPLAFAVNPAVGGHAISAYLGTTTCSGCVTINSSASGSTLVAFVGIGGTDTLTASDTYNTSAKWSHPTLGSGTNPIDESNDGEYLNVYVCANCSGGTSDALTLTGASNNLREVELIECTNTTVIDVSASAYNGGSGSTVSVSVTPTVANDLILAAAITGTGSFTLTPQTGGWTALDSTAGVVSQGSGYLASATTSAQNATMGRVTGTTALAGITLACKASGAGPTTSPSQFFLGASLWQRPVSLEAMAR